ncbi:MAG: cobalamin B12-binding domain-containing protein [Acidobacteria bacterium]|nr:cobalamin B12-binding domain-containing protein [Acidobacteriota bacterium]
MERDWCGELVSYIRGADRVAANALISDWAERSSYESAVVELMAPALELFGKLWADNAGDTSLAQGYVAAKVAEDLLSKVLALRETSGLPPAPAKGPVVVGNIEDDFHPLGRKMLVAFLRCDGWKVEDLGVDVSPGAFVDSAQEVGARVVGASAMMFSTAKNVKRLREEVDRRGLRGRLQIAAGGAVFRLRPELVVEFGADGTSPTALQAPALFQELWARSVRLFPG